MMDDKRFAAISASLRQKGLRMRCINTARGNVKAPVLILIEKATRREVARS